MPENGPGAVNSGKSGMRLIGTRSARRPRHRSAQAVACPARAAGSRSTMSITKVSGRSLDHARVLDPSIFEKWRADRGEHRPRHRHRLLVESRYDRPGFEPSGGCLDVEPLDRSRRGRPPRPPTSPPSMECRARSARRCRCHRKATKAEPRSYGPAPGDRSLLAIRLGTATRAACLSGLAARSAAAAGRGARSSKRS